MILRHFRHALTKAAPRGTSLQLYLELGTCGLDAPHFCTQMQVLRKITSCASCRKCTASVETGHENRRLKNLDPVTTRQYIDKAGHFFHGMKLLADDLNSYRSGIALLAVHSAISLSDAIKVGVTGKRGRYQNHAQSARELNRLCSSNGISNTQGVCHLAWLLGQKNAVAYEQRRIDDGSVRLAVDKAERFNAWAYNNFKEVLRGD